MNTRAERAAWVSPKKREKKRRKKQKWLGPLFSPENSETILNPELCIIEFHVRIELLRSTIAEI